MLGLVRTWPLAWPLHVPPLWDLLLARGDMDRWGQAWVFAALGKGPKPSALHLGTQGGSPC